MYEEAEVARTPSPGGDAIFLDAPNATAILEAAASSATSGSILVRISLDLNLSAAEVDVDSEVFRFGPLRLGVAALREIVKKPRKAFRLSSTPECGDEPASWEAIELFSDAHYQLVPTAGAPTAEIDGIQMHRTSGVDPFASAHAAAAAVVRRGDRIFETCGGLGYMAIAAVRLGAREVVSTELSDGMLWLGERNPWSRLATGLPIELVQADAFAHAVSLPPGSFDCVLHDPPRYSLSPDLYSQAFYGRLHGLLGSGGRLFHYTGNPYSKRRGRAFTENVRDRLKRAGFRVEERRELQGFVGRKD